MNTALVSQNEPSRPALSSVTGSFVGRVKKMALNSTVVHV